MRAQSGFLVANSSWWYIARSQRKAQTTRSRSASALASEVILFRGGALSSNGYQAGTSDSLRALMNPA